MRRRLRPVAPSALNQRVVEHRLVVVLAGDDDDLVPDARVDHPLVVRLGSKAFGVDGWKAVDQGRTDELVKKADETLVPSLSELPGFSGYYLIEAGNGVISSIGFFDTSDHADESTRVASNWVREQKLETALPNPPKITSGEVVAHKTRELVQA